MIGQHLVLRCKCGCFETSGTAGFKSAGISENMKQLPYVKTLDQEICKKLTWSDKQTIGANLSGLQNRGILRVYRSHDMTFISRSFPVKDLCTNSGDVPFHQTYLLTDDAQRQFFQMPSCILNRENFDVYEELDQRSGTLASGNPVVVNESYNLFSDVQTIRPYDVFMQCGLNEETFAKLIAAICDRVSGNGNVALVLPQVTNDTWETAGGSLLGEQILVALYQILPSCLTRFLSGVSYWNSDVRYVESFKFIVATKEISNALHKDSISLIDLAHNEIKNIGNSLNFGRLLWHVMQDEERLQQFHLFISDFFGQNVDQVRKVSAVMDIAAEMYLYKSASKVDISALSIKTLRMFGKSILNFPKIDKYCGEMLTEIKQYNDYNPHLEKVASEFVKANGTENSACYEPMMYILLQYVANETFSVAVKEMVLKKLQERNSAIEKQMIALLDHAKVHPISEKMADFFLNLLCGTEKISPDIQQQIIVTLSEQYDIFAKNGYITVCLNIMQVIFAPQFQTASEKQLSQAYDRLFALAYMLQEESQSVILYKILYQEWNRVVRQEQRLSLFCHHFFPMQNDVVPLLIQFQQMFDLFLLTVPYLKSNTDYSIVNWCDYYKTVFQNVHCPQNILFPENRISQIAKGKEKGIILYYVEVVRTRCDNYRPEWETIEAIFFSLSEEPISSRMKKFLQLLQYLERERKISFSNEIGRTNFVYYDYLYRYLQIQHQKQNDGAISIDDTLHQLQIRAANENVLVQLQKIGAEEEEKEPTLSEVFPSAYCKLWLDLLPSNAKASVDELVKQIKTAEWMLKDYLDKKSVMHFIHACIIPQMNIGSLRNASEDSIDYLYNALKDKTIQAKIWDCVYAYYDADHLTIGYKERDKFCSYLENYRNDANYQNRMDRRKVTLIRKKNCSLLEKQTLMAIVLCYCYCNNVTCNWNYFVSSQTDALAYQDMPYYLCYGMYFYDVLSGSNGIMQQNAYADWFTQEMCTCIRDIPIPGTQRNIGVQASLRDGDFYRLYRGVVQETYFRGKDAQKRALYEQAKATQDETLIEVFKVGGQNGRNQQNGNQQLLRNAVAVAVLFLLELVALVVTFFIKPDVGMILSVLMLILLIAWIAVIEIGLSDGTKKKGKNNA